MGWVGWVVFKCLEFVFWFLFGHLFLFLWFLVSVFFEEFPVFDVVICEGGHH